MATEKRLISVDDWDTFFNEHIYNRCFRNEYEQGYTDALDRVDDWMDDHPTVDAVEVVHGRWINKTNVVHGQVDYMFVCSACGNIYWDSITDTFDYCPNCGAKMDGDGNVARD